MKIDLILLGEPQFPISWPLGEVSIIQQSSVAINSIVDKAATSSRADAWLFWDPALGFPDGEAIKSIFCSQWDVWHAGLKLGTKGLPQAVDFVHPIWMLNCDPDKDVAAASWRLSFRACMVRTEVLRKMGGLRPGFQSLHSAGLEWGHRLVKRGVMMRYAPELTARIESVSEGWLSAHDELLFAKYRFPTFWYRWAVFRFLWSGALPRVEILRSMSRIASVDRLQDPQSYDQVSTRPKVDRQLGGARVTVILPTLDRYDYVGPLLGQLREQTVKAHEIIVIDQTHRSGRDNQLQGQFQDLPLIWLEKDKPGQCSARNSGLRISTGDYVLFLDDDVEVPENYIQTHLETLESFNADSSSGIVFEPGERKLEGPKFIRTSDVFPAGNTLIKRYCLEKSGLFDLAYDQGRRADGDLGMRVMLTGACMVLNPNIEILHHRAPQGGLRAHGQRKVTRSSSRKKLTHVNLASEFEIYLAKRYFSERQVREMLWINVLSTFSNKGSIAKKALQVLIGGVMLPVVLFRLRRNFSDAERMLRAFPQIEVLEK